MRSARLLWLALFACGSRQPPAPAPDPDPDGDRITGAADRCPREPEPYNGTDDDDGCPDKPSSGDCVWIDVLQILDRIHFDRGSVEIPPASDPIMEAVAATIVGNPQLDRIAVIGGRAADESEKLAAARGFVVSKALITRGVPSDRLEAHGYSAPINADAAKSRAAWFVVVRIDGEDARKPGATWAPWERDCAANWRAHQEKGAPLDCACKNAKSTP
jgi:outer membrane protein OmpA-like peptidoglycan-associated protein